MTRVRAAAAVLLAAVATAGLPAHGHGVDLPQGRSAERQALLKQGERALTTGDTVAARKAFEQAGQIAHSADAEIGLVRADLQAGAYGEAMAFGAHTAGAHRDEPAGALLYAWLLAVGGQTEVAQQRLTRLAADVPASRARAAALQRLVADPAQRPGAAFQTPPLRLAPYATGANPGTGARVRAAATLMGDGATALAPARALQACRGGPLWLRNGLGQTVAAQATREPTATGLVVLRARQPLPAGAPWAARDAFPGSPGYVVAHVASASAQAAWPRLAAGFFLPAADGAGAVPRLGVDTPASAAGSPVFDAAGALAGVFQGDASPAGSARRTIVPVSQLRPAVPAAAPAKPAPRATADNVYEAGLRHALQVLCR